MVCVTSACGTNSGISFRGFTDTDTALQCMAPDWNRWRRCLVKTIVCNVLECSVSRVTVPCGKIRPRCIACSSSVS